MHHFREHVRHKLITIHKVPSEHQLADLGTKPQPRALFEAQREGIMQWDSETKTAKELARPGKHLKACEIIESLPDLNNPK